MSIDNQPLLPVIAERVTLTGYLELVSEFWAQGPSACERCDLFDDPGYCSMLHDRSVPNADCLGLLERDGIAHPDLDSGSKTLPAT
jgi:hypothetical protein